MATLSAIVSGQFQFPFLSNEILAETMMRLFFYQTEARSFVDAMRSDKNALGPENNLPIACCASETDALVHQRVSEAHASGAWLDKQKTKLRCVRLIRMLDKEDMPYILTIDLGNPAALPAGLEIHDELINNFRDQSFERLVPSVLFRVAEALSVSDPAHIANPVRAQDVWQPAPVRFRENAFDGLHAADELHTSCGRQTLKSGARLLLRESVEIFDRGLTAPRVAQLCIA